MKNEQTSTVSSAQDCAHQDGFWATIYFKCLAFTFKHHVFACVNCNRILDGYRNKYMDIP